MFENMTYEFLMGRMLERIPDTFDKRESSMAYNAIAPTAAEFAEMYIFLDMINDEGFPDTASYNALVKQCKSVGIVPNPATQAIVKGEFNIDVPIGSRFSLDNLNYIVIERITTGVFKLRCEDTGPISNLGKLIPIDYIEGLETAQLTEILINGEEDETEESLRDRYYKRLEGEAYGGNRADYIEKTNKLQDVGGVKVYPVWNGGGTTKLVIINSQYNVPTPELVNTVQEKIDPVANQGEGLGIAPIGHIVTVEGATSVPINISSTITYQEGWNFGELKSTIEQTIDDYFLELNKKWDVSNNIIVRVSQIETRLLDIEGVLDIENTQINGVAGNYTVDKDSIVKRGDIVG